MVIAEVPWIVDWLYIFFNLIEMCDKLRLADGSTVRTDVEYNCDVRSPRLQKTKRFQRLQCVEAYRRIQRYIHDH